MPKWTEEQYEAITKDNTNIIVSAGAGSGKTAVLSERVLRKLKEGIHINELLILTFTKAAASEMKERIRKKIKDNMNLKEELNLIDSAYITTFDSYALSIVKKYHYLLNLPKNIGIIDSSIVEIKKKEIMDSIFESYYEEKNDKFLNLINNFCVKDDKNVENSILNIARSLDLLTNKQEVFHNYVNNSFDLEKINKDIKKYNDLLIEKIEEINNFLDDLKIYSTGDYYTKVEDSLKLLLNSKTYDDIKINKNVKLPTLPKNSEENIKEIKDNISSTLKEMDLLTQYNDEQEIIDTILLTKDYVEIILEIIEKYNKKLNEYKIENNSFEFQDIALMSIELIKNNEEIKNEIKYSLNEIMIDEYQDTSDIQEEFINLIENNNVYMVGDIKQSIYRFRNANPYIFKNKYDNYSKGNNGYKIDLNKNFRSRKEVLTNINEIFNIAMDDKIGGADYVKSHQMIFGNDNYEKNDLKQNNNMEIYSYKYDKGSIYSKEEIEAFIIANDIKNKIKNKYQIYDKDKDQVRDITYNDFVILMDRTTSFDLYKKIFEYMQIPLSMLKDYKLNEGTDINIIKNIIGLILKVKNNEYDKEFEYYFISIMRSYLFSESDDMIFDYFINKNFKESELINKINKIIEDIDSMSNINIIDKIIDDFNFYEKIITIGDVEEKIVKIDAIRDMGKSLSELGYKIDDLKIYLEKLIDENYSKNYSIDNSENNSVKIMTIHKSKGLEYHICYYSGLYKSFNISDLKERFLYDNTYGIIVPYFKEGIGETIYKDLLKNKYIKEEISEKIRLFYVALTRAKEKMIIINLDDEKEKSLNKIKYRSFKDILDSIRKKIDKYYKEININNLEISKDYLIKKDIDIGSIIPKSNEIISVKEIHIENELAESKHFSKKLSKLLNNEEKLNIEFGKRMHYILELLDLKNPNLNIIEDKYQRKLIKRFLNQEILKNIKEGIIYKEYEFMYQEKDINYNGIIDLMIEYKNHIDIIDYKLKNINDISYIEQLKGYKKYIEKISNKDVNIYLYSIMDGKLECINELYMI